ncbi:Dihydrofolate reductase, partial [Galemys pyrenaicus]
GMRARAQGPSGSTSPQPQLPGVCEREHVANPPCGGARGGVSPEQMRPRGRGGHNYATNLAGNPVSAAAGMGRPLNCIVAVSQNMGIGKNGNLPWPPLRNEFNYFRRMTTTSSVEGKQNLVIMGRKTWFSIPEKNRPLKDRINLVLSRELKEPPPGAHFLAKSLDDALKLIEQPELTNKVDMVWIVGGSSVYKEVMNKPGHLRLFVTRIMQEFESDTFFPEIDLNKYKLLPEYPGVLSDVQEEKGIKYKFEVYEKND